MGESTEKAGLGRRLGAFGIDFVLAIPIFMAVIFFSKLIFFDLSQPCIGRNSGDVFLAVYVAMIHGPFIGLIPIFLTEGVWGTSPGKKLFGILICDSKGQPPTRYHLVLRCALKSPGPLLMLINMMIILSCNTSFEKMGFIFLISTGWTVIWFGGGFLFLFQAERRTFHDRLAGTAVCLR